MLQPFHNSNVTEGRSDFHHGTPVMRCPNIFVGQCNSVSGDRVGRLNSHPHSAVVTHSSIFLLGWYQRRPTKESGRLPPYLKTRPPPPWASGDHMGNQNSRSSSTVTRGSPLWESNVQVSIKKSFIIQETGISQTE